MLVSASEYERHFSVEYTSDVGSETVRPEQIFENNDEELWKKLRAVIACRLS